MENETLESQVDRLARYIQENYPETVTIENGGAVDTAIVIMQTLAMQLNSMYKGLDGIEKLK